MRGLDMGKLRPSMIITPAGTNWPCVCLSASISHENMHLEDAVGWQVQPG